jgi:hypothetical protein
VIGKHEGEVTAIVTVKSGKKYNACLRHAELARARGDTVVFNRQIDMFGGPDSQKDLFKPPGDTE